MGAEKRDIWDKKDGFNGGLGTEQHKREFWNRQIDKATHETRSPFGPVKNSAGSSGWVWLALILFIAYVAMD